MNIVEKESILNDFLFFEKISEHEQVVFCNDPETGLKAIIAIHNTTLGPALGGCRMYPYTSLNEAIEDVLRLSKGMTYKCAAADLDFGGGKAVIIGDPDKDKSPELFRAFGQFVDSLGGRFYTGTDMGTNVEDFIQAYKETDYIVGLPESYGGGGDSSIPTAMGILYGLKAVNQTLFGKESLGGVTYAIQGLGKVGYKVAESLLKEGANLIVTDVNAKRLKEIEELAKSISGNLKIVSNEEIYSEDADIFVPCAIGGIINDQTIEQLKVKAIAGSANNQLLNEEHAKKLFDKGILYAPDYIINSGGLIQVADELYGVNKERVLEKTKRIYDSLLEVFQQSTVNKITTLEAANLMCEDRILSARIRNNFFKPSVGPKWQFQK